MDKDEYKKLLRKCYENLWKQQTQSKNKIDTWKINEKLSIGDRIERMEKNEYFITLHDHKPESAHKETWWLINHFISDIGKISVSVLDKMNKKTKEYQTKHF